MKKPTFFAQIFAAQRLATAFESGRTPAASDLDILGMPPHMKDTFRR
nr:hypothetical protein [Pararhizobium sp. IMCC3301]